LCSANISDTGYRSTPGGPVCPIFKGDLPLPSRSADDVEIKSRLGAPDLALLPIAAGACLPFIESLLHIRLNHNALTRHIHSPPEDAILVHQDLGAKASLGIHWGTFTTDAGARATVEEFQKVNCEEFELCDVGVWAGGRNESFGLSEDAGIGEKVVE